MISIDRSQPSFVARAVGVLTGRIRPEPDGHSATIITRDDQQIPAVIGDGARRSLLDDPSLFGEELDLLCWPKTRKKDLEVIVIALDRAATTNPDRDKFLIQGMNIGSKGHRVARIGIKPNTSDRKNTSNFDRFWLSLHGVLTDDTRNVVYRIIAKRIGQRLFILESEPQIRPKKGCTSLPSPNPRPRSGTPVSERRESARDRPLVASRP